MLTPDFSFIHTAIIQPYKGDGINGPEYGTPYTVKCRATIIRQRRQQSPAGFPVVAKCEVWFPAGTRIEPDSKVTVLGGTYILRDISPCYDFSGENHVEAWLI